MIGKDELETRLQKVYHHIGAAEQELVKLLLMMAFDYDDASESFFQALHPTRSGTSAICAISSPGA